MNGITLTWWRGHSVHAQVGAKFARARSAQATFRANDQRICPTPFRANLSLTVTSLLVHARTLEAFMSLFFLQEKETFMEIPVELVPSVRRLLAKRAIA